MGIWYDLFKEEGDNAMTTNQAIKVGDHVRFSSNGEYFGVVKEVETKRIIYVTTSNGLLRGAQESMLEIDTRLTPDEAWAELPFRILAKLNNVLTWHGDTLYAGEQSAIRHECYKLLGGAGIKVTDEVKERVRKAIERIADAMGVELA